ncbi:MAG: hypothetical protein CMD37_02290, partial [Flavobacteriales bacterium]|nr:hypothetical protein [Flavobacteriales bacterium]
VKSLNSRYFDSKISIPSALSTYELEIDNIAKNKLLRGKVDLTIKISGLNNDLVTFNKKVIKKYIDDLSKITDFERSMLLKSVLSLQNSIEKGQVKISKSKINVIIEKIKNVIDDVVDFRKKEGENIKKDFEKNIHLLKKFSSVIEKNSNSHKERIKEDLENKSKNINIENDYGRFEQELFYYLEKMDINEEIVRLNSHFKFFLEILNNNKIEKGKKLGFICQEIGREINTIGSKCNNSAIQNSVVEMKSSLEKIREQSLNVL